MPKISLIRGFKDPVTRPRFIIWTGVVVLCLVPVVIVALGVTSTYWFCAEGCHKVQDDAIAAYDASSHSEISCMACHMPVGADPITFVLHKMKALGELYLTVTNKFELPLNPHDHVAVSEEMESKQCVQCHNLEHRKVTPGKGIIIDHKAHEEAEAAVAPEEEYAAEISCTWCHNRIAHNEDEAPPTLKHPSGEETKPHVNNMKMTACFRCHTLTDKSYSEQWKAPGACAKCHPKDFDLKPASHKKQEFYPAGHAEMAKEEKEHNAEVTKEYEELAAEGDYFPLPPVGEVFYCGTCHVEKTFCFNCHGMDMPHSAEFKEKKHPEVAKAKFDKCVLCHDPAKTQFCNSCHHGEKSKWEYDKKATWISQHFKAVQKSGVKTCLDTCHDTKFCVACHKGLRAAPSSHRKSDWLRKSGKDLGVHAANFKGEPTGCEICHGANAPNKNSFCKACHKYEMPHADQFKKNHLATGKKDPNKCRYCHGYREICSNCHHEGASTSKPWLQVHGGVVNKDGGAACFEKCHPDRNFCVKCHTSRKVVPASHKKKGWTKRPSLTKAATHPQTYKTAPESCTYCHGQGGPESKFCMACHKIKMPHDPTFGPAEGAQPAVGKGGEHETSLRDKKISRAVCSNCHATAFCNKCHHQYTGGKAWVNAHPDTVKKSGAEACFNCHKETYCSFCHVRRAQQFIR